MSVSSHNRLMSLSHHTARHVALRINEPFTHDRACRDSVDIRLKLRWRHDATLSSSLPRSWWQILRVAQISYVLARAAAALSDLSIVRVRHGMKHVDHLLLTAATAYTHCARSRYEIAPQAQAPSFEAKHTRALCVVRPVYAVSPATVLIVSCVPGTNDDALPYTSIVCPVALKYITKRPETAFGRQIYPVAALVAI